MSLNEDQRRLLQTNLARDKAEALLQGLLRARSEAEQRIAASRDMDPQRIEQGRHAMQKAIESAQRMVDSLNSAMACLADEMSQPELSDILGKTDPPADACEGPEEPKQ
jgi:hypothetical protein